MSTESRVIYKDATSGRVVVVVPAPAAVAKHGIEAIAQKDVPAGVPYKIVSVDDIPSDRTFRNAWDIDAALLTDGVGSESNEFPAPVEPEPEPAATTVAAEPAPAQEEEVFQ